MKRAKSAHKTQKVLLDPKRFCNMIRIGSWSGSEMTWKVGSGSVMNWLVWPGSGSEMLSFVSVSLSVIMNKCTKLVAVNCQRHSDDLGNYQRLCGVSHYQIYVELTW